MNPPYTIPGIGKLIETKTEDGNEELALDTL